MNKKRIYGTEDLYLHNNAKRTRQYYQFIIEHDYPPPYYSKQEERYLTNEEYAELKRKPARQTMVVLDTPWTSYFEGNDGNAHWYPTVHVEPHHTCYRCGKPAREHCVGPAPVTDLSYPEEVYQCRAIGYYIDLNCFDEQLVPVSFFDKILYDEEDYSFTRTQ